MKINIINAEQMNDTQFIAVARKINSLRKSFMPENWSSQWSENGQTYVAEIEQHKQMPATITVMVFNELSRNP